MTTVIRYKSEVGGGTFFFDRICESTLLHDQHGRRVPLPRTHRQDHRRGREIPRPSSKDGHPQRAFVGVTSVGLRSRKHLFPMMEFKFNNGRFHDWCTTVRPGEDGPSSHITRFYYRVDYYSVYVKRDVQDFRVGRFEWGRCKAIEELEM